MDKYRSTNYLGILMSFSYILNIICRYIFNLNAKNKIEIDRWAVLDVVAAFVNVFTFTYIGNRTPEEMTN